MFIGTLAVLLLNLSLFAATTPQVVAVYTLPATSLAQLGRPPYSDAALTKARANGLKFTDLPSIGSGLSKLGDAEFIGITDRGPNGQVETPDGERRTFPLPQFTPTLVRFKLVAESIRIEETIPLTNPQGRPVSGLSNMEGDERLFASGATNAPLPFDPDGVDPEALRVLPDGRFLLAEEYGPSILVVNTNGQVLVRYLPRNKPLPGATCPVKPILPTVLSHRRLNRGFESLALSADGRTAWAILQSPAGDADSPRFKHSRVTRVVRLDLTEPLNAIVTGHFLLPLSAASDYGPNQKQAGIKLNDAEWSSPDRLLVLETGESARLMVADFRKATNLLGRPDEDSLEFEAAGDDLSRLPVKPAITEVWADLRTVPGLSRKLEGLAVLSATEILLANDNDFGLGDNTTAEPSCIWRIRLARPLPIP